MSVCARHSSASPMAIIQTVKFKSELSRNITIKLGYANAKVRRAHVNDCHAQLPYIRESDYGWVFH